jgi:hypothetical protein
MRHLSISISWLMAGGPPGTCLRRKRDRQAQTGLGVSSHRPRCLRTCPPLEDLFYDVFGLNESDDGHRPMASFDRLRTGLGQVIEQSRKQRLTQRPPAFFLE